MLTHHRSPSRFSVVATFSETLSAPLRDCWLILGMSVEKVSIKKYVCSVYSRLSIEDVVCSGLVSNSWQPALLAGPLQANIGRKARCRVSVLIRVFFLNIILALVAGLNFMAGQGIYWFCSTSYYSGGGPSSHAQLVHASFG